MWIVAPIPQKGNTSHSICFQVEEEEDEEENEEKEEDQNLQWNAGDGTKKVKISKNPKTQKCFKAQQIVPPS